MTTEDSTGVDVNAVLQTVVNDANAQLAPFETVKAFRVTERPFTTEGGELTASLKVKRKVVSDRYAALIEQMYR